MDFRAKETTWRSEADALFGNKGATAEDPNLRKVKEIKLKFRNLLHRRTKMWWNKISLETYIQRNLIPRGLRIQIFPSYGLDDALFTTKWEEICTRSSLSLMQVIIDHNTKQMENLDTEISNVQLQINQLLSSTELELFNTEINDAFKIWEKQIKDMKARKFQRDVQDETLGRIYKWKIQKDNLRSRSSSMASLSSIGAESNASQDSHESRSRRVNERRFDPYRRQQPRRWARGEKNNERSKTSLKVINLSDVDLTSAQLEVLSLGMSFSPVSPFDCFLAVKDLHLFARKLVFKKHFHQNTDLELFPSSHEQEALRSLEELLEEQQDNSANSKFPTDLLPKSKAFPPFSGHPNIELFVQLVSRDLYKLSRNGEKTQNCTLAQRRAIDQLAKMRDVVIKPSDKGGNVVVWPVKAYEREALRQLRDSSCYRKLTFNPLNKYTAELTTMLEQAFEDNIITRNQLMALLPKYPKVSSFYLLPKVHKELNNPPGRPIVAGMGSLCEPICRYVDHHLYPLVEELPSYLKDTTDILRKLDGIYLDKDMYLVTCDVESLYTSIRHTDGIEAARFFLNMSGKDSDLVSFVVSLLGFALTHNFFIFRETLYLQLQGTAMGAACAPSYANLFLGLWERDIFLTNPKHHIEKVQLWSRYIDDVIMIWQGTEDELHEFMSDLNTNSLNIKLTYRMGRNDIEFLDVLFDVDENGLIRSDAYRKKTSTNSLLHASSSHPAKLIRSIPTGQFLRIRRICSTDSNFEKQATDMRARFQERGYPMRTIEQGYQRAKRTKRTDLLTRKIKKSGKDDQVRFITTYDSQSDAVRSILVKHWSLLRIDRTLEQYLPVYPSITYRRSKNLKDYLVRSYHRGQSVNRLFGSKGPKWGSRSCGSCVACPNVETTNTFWDSSHQREFTITHHINGTTVGVVYLATCPCGLSYVGLTSRELRRRTREHVLGIEAAKNEEVDTHLKTLPRHFKSYHNCDGSLLKLVGF
ncbi:uncharacterized protein [Engystomops pustulosus]|uniref:uncharacterized protein n=1 Tax=Engystomops pustulosus TaxID=76066 RepID=UPI003AFB08C9